MSGGDRPIEDYEVSGSSMRGSSGEQRRPISASIVTRYSDGTEKEIQLHEGGELDLRIERDGGYDDVSFGAPVRRIVTSHRIAVTVDATYYGGASLRADGAYATFIERPGVERPA